MQGRINAGFVAYDSTVAALLYGSNLMTTTSHFARRLRFAGLLAGGLAMIFAAASRASAQDAVRDRGDRYSRAQAENTSRARTRSDDNSAMERPRGEIVRRSDDGFRGNPGHGGFDSRFDRNRSDSRFDRDRFDARHDSGSRISVGLGLRTSYSTPAYHYNNAPRYRSVEHRAPYTSYRPAHHYNVYPRYEPYHVAPAPRIIYSTTYYDYRPFSSTYRPAHGASYSHYPHYSYPRYSHPRTSISFGLRYDYRR